ncbi:hypothetical protein EVC29_036 [Rhizobium phage RHph_Y52]|nr:hypothetical protein EVC16_036 [Rhizobium phage RHph_Y21]QIG76737.1 hypothetical protein EVC29_036 [Rhizobium phage RHph_Y52]
MKYVFAILAAFLIAAGVMLKFSWSANDTLKADKLKLEQRLATTESDLKMSVSNANLMLSEKNRLLDLTRKQADVNQREAVEAAKIQKDIDHAEDSKRCAESEPVKRALRGLFDNSGAKSGTADPAIQGARRPGNATDLPAAPGTTKP